MISEDHKYRRSSAANESARIDWDEYSPKIVINSQNVSPSVYLLFRTQSHWPRGRTVELIGFRRTFRGINLRSSRLFRPKSPPHCELIKCLNDVDDSVTAAALHSRDNQSDRCVYVAQPRNRPAVTPMRHIKLMNLFGILSIKRDEHKQIEIKVIVSNEKFQLTESRSKGTTLMIMIHRVERWNIEIGPEGWSVS